MQYQLSVLSLILIGVLEGLYCGAVDAHLGVIIANGATETQFFPTVIAAFGPNLPVFGVNGVIVPLQTDGCKLVSITKALGEVPSTAFDTMDGTKANMILLLPRGNCTFDKKIYMAQAARASAVIVYDFEGEVTNNTDFTDFPDDTISYTGLIQMTSSRNTDNIKIPSTFISLDHGTKMIEFWSELIRSNRPYVAQLYALHSEIDYAPNDEDGDIFDQMYMGDLIILFLFGISFTSLCGLLSLIAMLLTRYRMHRERILNEIKNRMTAAELKTIKIRCINDIGGCSADPSQPNVCAICLDDLEAGAQVRDLPCRHWFHIECIDDWLLKRHKSCPTCRQDILTLMKKKQQQTQKMTEIKGDQPVSVEVAAQPLLAPTALEFIEHGCRIYDP